MGIKMNARTIEDTRAGAKYRVLGSNDDASSCLCCGREGLKRVVWMQPLDQDGNDEGGPVHFGTVCAGKAAGWGYGGNRDACERRAIKEEVAAMKHYAALASAAVARLVASGVVIAARVAFRFDWKSGTHSYGYIYTLPSDPITSIDDPVSQAAEIKDAKARLRAVYPIFRICDEHLSAMALRGLLADRTA
jgi:hypothetical protein